VLCYVHLPFCDRICPYCDFAVVEFRRERVERYLRALRIELSNARPQEAGTTSTSNARPQEAGTTSKLGTLYLGGGTPSALDADQIAKLLADLFAHFGVEVGGIECTLEANPSRNVKDLARYRQAGVTRLSVGVQSFDDAELHRLGRDHSGAQAEAFVHAARRAGHGNVSIDLIAGAPGQTPTSFAATLERAIACAPDHVSVYALTIEASTPYARWHEREPQAFPEDDAVADLLEQAHTTLTHAGYEHYEISNFARPGFACAHNRGYWRQYDCIALGMSASGYENGLRYRNVRDFDAYCTAIESGNSARDEVERLDFADRVGEAAMLALRTSEGMEDQDFRDRFGLDMRTVFLRPIEECRRAGLLEETRHGVRLTSRGRLLANAACAQFLHPSFLPAPAASGETTS